MVAARSVRVPALWCHPAGVDGSSVPSLSQLPELSWVINNESFGKIMVDHCAFGVARRRWGVPFVLLYTSLPSLNEVVGCCPSRFRCQGDHQHHAINVLTTGDAEYIPIELSNLLAHCICSEIGLFSVPDSFVCAGAPSLSDDGLWQFFRPRSVFLNLVDFCTFSVLTLSISIVSPLASRCKVLSRLFFVGCLHLSESWVCAMWHSHFAGCRRGPSLCPAAFLLFGLVALVLPIVIDICMRLSVACCDYFGSVVTWGFLTS